MKVDKTKWEKVSFDNAVNLMRPNAAVQKKDYAPVGLYPIVSQEKELVSGYSNDKACLNMISSPVVIFGDHTRVVKYVDFDFVVGADGVKVLLPNSGFEAKFLFYNLSWAKVPNNGYSRHFKFLRQQLITLPSLPEQQAIAAELDTLQSVIDKLQEQLNDYDELSQSIFHEMFGDVVNNDRGWETKQLQDIGSLKNGLNYDKNEKGYSIRIVGVGDFKDLRRIDDISTLSLISLMQKLSEDYLLKDGDIVFVRSNGNKNLVGRSVEVYPHNENVTFSGFCIRFRKEEDCVTNKYLIYLLTEEEYKKHYILKSNGIGIKSINQKILGQAIIPLPPLSLQRQFAERVEAIEAQKALVRQQIADTHQLFDSRMQYYFE